MLIVLHSVEYYVCMCWTVLHSVEYYVCVGQLHSVECIVLDSVTQCYSVG